MSHTRNFQTAARVLLARVSRSLHQANEPPAKRAVLPQETKPGKGESFAQVESLVAPNSGCGLKPVGSTKTPERRSTGKSRGSTARKRPGPLAVRFSAAELATIRAKAKGAGCSTNRYIRAAALGSDYRAPLDPELARALLALRRELAAQGNNLNQIARQLNAGIVLPGQDALLDALALSTEETHRAVRRALSRRQSEAGE